jgi:alpha-beta hydrolase superfamily lysophospholipase
MNGSAHWTSKKVPEGEIRLFLWRKEASTPARGTVLFVHGSSMASQPTFDLEVPGRPDSSVMDWFAARGFECWCLDNEGYGRSARRRPCKYCAIPAATSLPSSSRWSCS